MIGEVAQTLRNPCLGFRISLRLRQSLAAGSLKALLVGNVLGVPLLQLGAVLRQVRIRHERSQPTRGANRPFQHGWRIAR